MAYGLGRWGRYGRLSWPFVRDVGVTGVAVAVWAFLLYLPFYIGFQSQAGGLLPTLYVGTRFRQYFVMFGPFLVAIAGLLTLLARQVRREQSGQAAARAAGWVGRRLFVLAAAGHHAPHCPGHAAHCPRAASSWRASATSRSSMRLSGDDPWLAVLGRLLLVKLRTWVMPLVVAAMAALGWVLLQRSLLLTPALSPGGEGAAPSPQGRGAGVRGNLVPQPPICPALRRRRPAADPQRRVLLPGRQLSGCG